VAARDAAAQREVESRRAGVQLARALPQMVVEPPKRRLDRMLDKQRDTGANFEARIRSEQRREGRFRQPLPAGGQQYNEPNPPPVDTIPDGPGARGVGPGEQVAKALNRRLHPINDEPPARPAPLKEPATAQAKGDLGIPNFLDRRRPTSEPTYLDLVGANDDGGHAREAR
jgi:hypothetical protein